MRYAVVSEHRDYYRKHGAIEFDGLLSADQLRQLNGEIDTLLAVRLGVDPKLLSRVPPQLQFMAAHDLWRDNASIKKLVWQPRFAEIASELIEIKPLRIGYDQYYPNPSRYDFVQAKGTEYADLLGKELTLSAYSSLQEVLCGLMICLHSQAEGIVAEPGDSFPTIAGNGTFINPETMIKFDRLRQLAGNRYILLVYAQKTTVYVLREDDPHKYTLKNQGYALGDKLSDKLNPIVFS